jgi:hypothetical protein
LVQGEKIYNNTFRTASVETLYTPGEAIIMKTMLYSCALNDPPEYFSDARKSYFNIKGDEG